jgi:hypothetical protein
LFHQFEISTKFQVDSFDCVVEKSAAGPELPRDSYNTDLFVTYVDKWMWDITLYLLELTITLESSELAALGRRQLLDTSLTGNLATKWSMRFWQIC